MSDDLYSTRLRWSNGRGVAMLHRHSVPLTEPPVLGGEPVYELDYTPEVGCIEIRRHAWDTPGEMTEAEVAEADAMLRCVA